MKIVLITKMNSIVLSVDQGLFFQAKLAPNVSTQLDVISVMDLLLEIVYFVKVVTI